MRTVSRLITLCLVLLAGCTQSRTPDGRSGNTSQGSTDSVQAHLTDHYVRLLRGRLSAEDPYQAQVAVNCEALRILRVVRDTSPDKLQGENEANRLMRAAERRAYTIADSPARRRVDSALAGRVFDADDNCDSLARAGVLGDTVWPKFKKWKE